MGRGEQTREHIVERAAALFNRQGYAGASMADLMDATGLQKGGIYRHFESKEALALEAFDFAVRRMGERFAAALEGRTGALPRLLAVVEVFARVPEDPPVPGGCPMLNASVEHADGNPLIRQRAREAMDGLHRLIRRTVQEGIDSGELRAALDPAEVASVLSATLEGGVMLARLYDDPAHMRRAVEHLRSYLEAQTAA